MCPVWGNVNATTLRDLQIVQNRAIKCLFGFEYLTPTDSVYFQSNILPLSFTVRYFTLLLGYKVFKGLTRVNTVFITNSSVHSYSTRNMNDYRTLVSNSTTYGTMGLYNTLVSEFNKLPLVIKNASTVSSFRSKILPFLWHDYLE